LQLPITERVLQNGYVHSNTLRSRIRTLTVPGTERALELRAGEVVADDPEPEERDCDAHAYVSLLGSD
jgi:hypothetical protein